MILCWSTWDSRAAPGFWWSCWLFFPSKLSVLRFLGGRPKCGSDGEFCWFRGWWFSFRCQYRWDCISAFPEVSSVSSPDFQSGWWDCAAMICSSWSCSSTSSSSSRRRNSCCRGIWGFKGLFFAWFARVASRLLFFWGCLHFWSVWVLGYHFGVQTSL